MSLISNEGNRYRTEETEKHNCYSLRLGRASVVTVPLYHRGKTSKRRVCHLSQVIYFLRLPKGLLWKPFKKGLDSK